MKSIFALSLAIILGATFEIRAEDWPRFRGIGGSGVSVSTKVPVEFNAENHLSWKLKLTPGHSSPVVCGNQLYITGFEETVLRTYAIDTLSGRTIWTADLPRSRKAKQHSLNNAASPTPACDATGVVVFFADFGLATWSKGGKAGWRKPLPALVTNHGVASSPTLAAGIIVQIQGSDLGSEVLAFRRDSGKEIWRDKLQGVTYATPSVTPDGQVIVISTGELVAFELKTGRRRWWLGGVPYQPKSSPILSADGKIVYFSALSVEERSKAALSSYEKLLQQFDVDGDGKITIAEMQERKGPVGAFPQIDVNGDGVFTRSEQQAVMRSAEIPHIAAAVATDGNGDVTKSVKWSIRKGIPSVSSPILVDHILYLFKEGGVLTSIKAADGVLVKEGRISSTFGLVFSSPVAAGGKLYIADQQGKVAVLEGGAEWSVIAINDLGEDCYATPAISGDRLYIRTVSTLWCFRNPA